MLAFSPAESQNVKCLPHADNGAMCDMVKTDIRVPRVELSFCEVREPSDPICNVLCIIVPCNIIAKINNTDWARQWGAKSHVSQSATIHIGIRIHVIETCTWDLEFDRCFFAGQGCRVADSNVLRTIGDWHWCGGHIDTAGSMSVDSCDGNCAVPTILGRLRNRSLG